MARRVWVPTALAVSVIGLTAAACGGSSSGGSAPKASGSSAAASNQVINVGDSNPFTGPSASYGALITDGFMLGLHDHQTNGSPNIQLDKQDDGCDPTKAVTVIQGFISGGKVQAVLGPGCSGAMAATQKLMANAQLVHSSGGYGPSLTQGGDKFYFRTVPNDIELNTALAKYIASQGHKTLAIVNDDTAYGTGGADVMVSQAEANGMKVSYHGKFTYGATDFSGQVQRLRDSHADAFFFDGYEGELGVLVKQVRQAGLKQPIFGPTAMGNDEFLQPAGSAANGVIWISNFNRGNPKTKDFVDRYKQQFNLTATDVAAASYLNGVAYAEAFKVAGPNAKGQQLADALRGLHVQTPLGEISFDQNGDLLHPPILLGKIVNGQPTLLQDLSGS